MEDTQTTLPEPTLREELEAQFDAVTSTEAPVAAPSKEEVGTPVEERPGRTAGRARDEHGRLLPGKAEVPVQVLEAAKPEVAPTTVTPVPEAVPRPSSWKKEMWGHFEKLDPEVAKYINQREQEFAKGVSTYKQEYENARPVMEAIAPHIPLLQQHGIDPGQQVGRYMQIHRTLATGSPQDKLGIFMQLAKDYQVPVENMFVRGNDGQVYLNTQIQAPQLQQPQPDFERVIETKLVEREAQQAARQFTEAKDAAGNPQHPHFEVVRETMSQLLASGLAQDLESAYNAALRLPAHSDLYAQLQQQESAQHKAEEQKKLADAAALARRNSVSVRGSTPSKQSGQTATGLRGTLEQAFDEHVPGRV